MKSDGDWVAELQRVQRERVPQIPGGWLTAEAIAKKNKTSLSFAKDLAKRLYDAGRAERRKFKVLYDCGVRSVYHYRLKK